MLFYGWLEIEDSHYYLRNPLLLEGNLLTQIYNTWVSAPQSNWMPLTWTLAIAIKSVFGFNALAFHLCSLTLHIANVLLLYRFTQKLALPGVQVLFVTMVFALHPLQVESVAWASSMKGVLSALFALLALNVVEEEKTRSKTLLLSGLFFLCLLSKQTLLALPLVLLCLAHRTNFIERSLRFLPLFLLSVSGLIAALLANRNHPHVHTLEYLWLYPMRVISAIGHYLYKTIVPTQLHPEYQWHASWPLLLLGLIVMAVTILLLARRHPAGGYSAAFIILLMPALGVTASPLEFAADRLIYFPLIFLLIAVSYLFTWVKNQNAALSIVLLLTVLLGFLARNQVQVWSSDKSLCLHTLECTPNHFLAKVNLGLIHARKGEFNEAETILRENVLEHPERLEPVQSLSKVLLAKGEVESAIYIVEEAAERVNNRNDYLIALAQTYQNAGQGEEALKALHLLLEREPQHPVATELIKNITCD